MWSVRMNGERQLHLRAGRRRDAVVSTFIIRLEANLARPIAGTSPSNYLLTATMATVLAIGAGVAAAAFFVRSFSNPLHQTRTTILIPHTTGSRRPRSTPKIPRWHQRPRSRILQRRFRAKDDEERGGADSGDFVRDYPHSSTRAGITRLT